MLVNRNVKNFYSCPGVFAISAYLPARKGVESCVKNPVTG
jgi:hypothetical protein